MRTLRRFNQRPYTWWARPFLWALVWYHRQLLELDEMVAQFLEHHE